jgi:hypothetical protein
MHTGMGEVGDAGRLWGESKGEGKERQKVC